VNPTHQDLSNDSTFSQIKSRVPVPLKGVVLYHKKVDFEHDLTENEG